MSIVYFVPLTWPLNGMECDIGGRGVDNAVTTSGKEVQEALVNSDRTRRLGRRARAPRARVRLRTNTDIFLPVQGKCGTIRTTPELLPHGTETLTDRASCCPFPVSPALLLCHLLHPLGSHHSPSRSEQALLHSEPLHSK